MCSGGPLFIVCVEWWQGGGADGQVRAEKEWGSHTHSHTHTLPTHSAACCGTVALGGMNEMGERARERTCPH